MKILMLSATFPYPPTRGGTQVRTFNLLKYLSQRHNITLVTQRSPDVTDAEVSDLKAWVDDLIWVPAPDEGTAPSNLWGKLTRFGRFLWQNTPPNVLHLYSAEIRNWVDQAIATDQFEVITCEHSVNEIYVRPEFRQRLRTVVNVHSSVYGTCKNQLQTRTAEKPGRDRLNLPLLWRYEQRYCQKFSHIVVTTPDDQRQMQAFNPNSQICVIPNGVDLEMFPARQTDPGGHRLVFIGALDNLANIDAALFLGQAILPALRSRYPDVTLSLVGSRPTPEVKALSQEPGITVTGRVPSMVDYLHQATVCVIPMRTGFGIKNKTLEAMAAGVPVVGSDRGLEGLAVDQPGEPLRALRANGVEEYVAAIARLFESADLRAELSRNGRLLIEQDYTWERAGQLYEQVLTQA